jgi:catechol 2,3-dioxygenase-like lactoylglutathione lyase family enzyme
MQTRTLRSRATAVLVAAVLASGAANGAEFRGSPPPPASPPAAAEPASALASALLRTAIVVADLDAAKRFYVEGLGLAVRYEGDITRPAVAHQLGLAPGQMAWFVVLDTAARLGERDVRSAMIGLLHVARPALPRVTRPEGAALAAGEAMLAIETTRIDEVERRLRLLGARFVVEPHAAPDGSEIEMVIRDPDGTRVHVVQRVSRATAGR